MNPIAAIDTVQNLATDKVNTLIENHPLVVITNQMAAEINSKLDKHINDFGITKISINHQMELMNNTMSQSRDDTSKIETNMVNLKTEFKTEMKEFNKDMGDRMDKFESNMEGRMVKFESNIGDRMDKFESNMGEFKKDMGDRMDKFESNMGEFKKDMEGRMVKFESNMGDRMDKLKISLKTDMSEIKGLLYQLLLNGSNNNRNSNARSSNDGNN